MDFQSQKSWEFISHVNWRRKIRFSSDTSRLLGGQRCLTIPLHCGASRPQGGAEKWRLSAIIANKLRPRRIWELIHFRQSVYERIVPQENDLWRNDLHMLDVHFILTTLLNQVVILWSSSFDCLICLFQTYVLASCSDMSRRSSPTFAVCSAGQTTSVESSGGVLISEKIK